MSHVVKLNLAVKNIKALERAAKKLGLVFNKDAKTFNYYHTYTDKCDHSISAAGEQKGIGVIKSGNEFTLKWDPGYLGPKMSSAIGLDAEVLKKEYAVAAATLEAEAEGMFVTRYDQKDGSVKLEAAFA